jgi:hypothetical protein
MATVTCITAIESANKAIAATNHTDFLSSVVASEFDHNKAKSVVLGRTNDAGVTIFRNTK